MLAVSCIAWLGLGVLTRGSLDDGSWRLNAGEPPLIDEKNDPRNQRQLAKYAADDEPSSRRRCVAEPIVDVVADTPGEEPKTKDRERAECEEAATDATVQFVRGTSEKSEHTWKA